MNYYLLLTIKVLNSPFYIEVGLVRSLPFHPNLTDLLSVGDYYCKIKEIFFDLDNQREPWLKLEAGDAWVRKNSETMEDCHKRMQSEFKDLKEWCHSNKDRLVLNDYYMNPERDYLDKQL